MRKSKSLPYLMLISCLLLIVLNAQSLSTLAQQTASSPATASGLTLDFTAQVYRKAKAPYFRANRTSSLIIGPVENLTTSDFRLFEDGREQTILSVERETRPLSIVAVVTLGRGPYCEGQVKKTTVSKTMDILAQAFTQALRPEDQLALIITDEDATMLRSFAAAPVSIAEDFAKVGPISDANDKSFSGISLPRTITSHKGVEKNYVEQAVRKAIAYLKQNKRSDNRSVVLFMRDIYHASSISFDAQQEVNASLLEGGVIVGDLGVAFANYYNELPGLTGGDKESCYIFVKATDSAIPTATVSAMLDRLRTRYRITYNSTNPKRDGKIRKLKLELAPQWTKGKNKEDIPVVRAPQAIIAPDS